MKLWVLRGALVAASLVAWFWTQALIGKRGFPQGRIGDRLLADVWEWDPVAAVRAAQGGAARAVDSHVKALRRKLGPDRIRTVHGVGYALEAKP